MLGVSILMVFYTIILSVHTHNKYGSKYNSDLFNFTQLKILTASDVFNFFLVVIVPKVY